MKANEFIGMKVLDKEANEVGKVAEIAVVFKKCLVDNIFISIGSALNKKYLVIVEEDIAEVGDYLQLKIDKEGIDEKVKVDKIEEFLNKGTRFKDFIGRTVLTINGMEVGKITDNKTEQLKGKIEQVEGKAQEEIGKVKRKAKE